MSIEQAIEAEAQAQAICMQTADFERAYHAFVAKEKPVFRGGLSNGGPELSELAVLRGRTPDAGACAGCNGRRARWAISITRMPMPPAARWWQIWARQAGCAHSAVDPGRGARWMCARLCLIRETLARHDGLADFAFAMQGLGTGAISLFGTPEQQNAWLPLTRAGKAISAFALTEPQSGSDVANSHDDGDARMATVTC